MDEWVDEWVDEWAVVIGESGGREVDGWVDG